MPILSKPEWEPIFREGLNLVTIEEFFDIGVSKFPYSKTRNQIFDGFLKYVEIVKSTNLAGEIWLNGSFLTLKEDPEDIDLVFRFSGIQVDKLSDTDKENLEDCLLKSYQLELKCDNYVLAEYPDNHPGYAGGIKARTHWLGLFGFNRNLTPKGFAFIKINGGIVL